MKNHKTSQLKTPGLLGCALSLLIALSGSHAQPRLPLSDDDVPLRTKQAALEGNWQAVADDLSDVAVMTVSPVKRMLKAFACGMLGRANEAALLTFGVNNLRDAEAWVRWTDELCADYGYSVSTIPVKCDALVHQQKVMADAKPLMATTSQSLFAGMNVGLSYDRPHTIRVLSTWSLPPFGDPLFAGSDVGLHYDQSDCVSEPFISPPAALGDRLFAGMTIGLSYGQDTASTTPNELSFAASQQAPSPNAARHELADGRQR